ncbi:MAG: glutamate-1-semialdehyde 2,1-aminomutase [Nitrosopumilus sp.]|nr:glutamate-1-semialdehyde 2,1-aminomutase [Nitrosopumilus sp.]MDA7952734.1 glutamate-1-semialdehyde 2,1-aminomutase [Nitrosopumilus sp.]MDA7957705.1 glutamate-1-semialdehyde 2,1-aminomutase [Nitrosopumilus sp.]MDA7960201.1 glutamate-1-semialdehyde 2,1-aminomutase [Nitrosopumilus sp.]
MDRSSRLYARSRRSIPSGVNSPVRFYAPRPFFASRARGRHIWDADGARYSDLCNGYGALLLGHADPGVARAAAAQARKGSLYCVPTEQEAELAELVTGLYCPGGRARLVNGGADAAAAAIRIARAATGRSKILKFAGCYHGAVDPLLVEAGSGAAGAPSSAGVPRQAARDTLVAPYNDAAAAGDLLDRHDVACVMVEPAAANMGLVPPGRGFLRSLRRLSRRAGALLVFDEVVTGFRLAPGGAQEAYGVRPDLTMLAKALGGGYPLAAVCGPPRLMDRLAPGGPVYQASTYAGNPVSVAAALAAVRSYKRPLYSRLGRMCRDLASRISDAASDAGVEHVVHHASSIFQVFFTGGPVRDLESVRRADHAMFGRMFRSLLSRGVFVAPSQYESSFLSAAYRPEDVAGLGEAYGAAIREASHG